MLSRLPNELFDIVLANLPCQDINDLRLTCRQARMKSFPFWSKTYFSTRQFSALLHLSDIAGHATG